MKRDVPAVAVSERGSTRRPLASPSPVSAHLRIIPERRASPTIEAGGLVPLDSKRWHLAPGVYRVSRGIVIETVTDLTPDEVHELIVEVSPGKPQRTPEEEARLAQMHERAKHLAQAYRDRLGEAPEDIERSVFHWLEEHGEDAVRQAVIATAVAVGSQKLDTPTERYEWLREVLRLRKKLKPKP